jgi:hypothetical protein
LRTVIRKGFQGYEILEGHESVSGNTIKEFRDQVSALDFLRQFLPDSSNMLNIRNLLHGLPVYGGISGLTDHQVLEQLAWRLVSCQFKLSVLPLWHIQARGQAPAVEEEQTVSPAAAPEPLHWIKIQIVYDDTDEPVGGVSLTVNLPNGKNKKTSSSKSGIVEDKDLPKGTWDIQATEYSSVLEVVEIS